MDDRESQPVVGREPCPSCGSRDNLARYADGGAHCFTPGCGHHEHGDGTPSPRPRQDVDDIGWLTGEARAIRARGLSQEACEKFDYRIGEHAGEPVQIATYWRDGRRVFQKIRAAGKRFHCKGKGKTAGLYGQHLWPATGRRIVITEGEVDAISVAQAFGMSWPVVSLPNGADSAVNAIREALLFLGGYEEVVLWFDNDDAGRKAVELAVPLLKPGTVKVAFAPEGYKDANDMLVAGAVKALCRVVYDAKPWRPEGIVTMADVRDRAMAPTVVGDPWPWAGVTDATFGRRAGEVYAFGAGSGVGKTDLFTQIIAHDAVTLNQKCGVLYLEQPVVETSKRIAGKLVGKRFHVPDGSWTQDELEAAFDRVQQTGNVYMLDAFGATSWSVIGPLIRYMIVSLGCTRIFLDHLTALAADEDDERRALERLMADLAGIAQETGAMIHFVSHLATPEGKPHEEGGRVQARHFKGSRAIIYWSHGMFGLERDTQAEDPEDRALATLRCLKDRFTGNATGRTWTLRYDQPTGLLAEDATGMPPIPRERAREDF